MGSPEFAVPILSGLARNFDVTGVVTQPDRPAGRGKALTAPPIKKTAQELGIPIIQPERMKEPGVFEQIAAWNPEAIVVAAFGQILRANILDLPPKGCINVHASLLPRWRGAAPITAAILAGDPQTGVSIMQMDPGVDTGPVYAQKSMEISPMDTSESLGSRLAAEGASLLLETLPKILRGNHQPIPQNESGATYASKVEKGQGLLDFHSPADELERKIRAFFPWPGTYFLFDNQPIKVLQAGVIKPGSSIPGKRSSRDHFPVIGTLDGDLVLLKVQPAGKNPMAGDVFLRGQRDWVNRP